MKYLKFVLLVPCLLFSLSNCSSSNDEPANSETSNKTQNYIEASKTMESLWATTPLNSSDSKRTDAFTKIQEYADAFTSNTFSTYMNGSGTLYDSFASTYPILACYDLSFDRVISGLKNDKPQSGEVYIWLLYNMGYVVKTPSGSFAIDVYHKRAAELAQYIDFYAITHVHNDHKSQTLIDAMVAAGKPVITNFLDATSYQYLADKNQDFTIGSFKIHTFVTNHNNGTTNVPVTAYQINCGTDAGNCVLLHLGDSNFLPEQYQVTEDVDVCIPRYAPNELTENNVIGAVFNPDYVLMSHILELSHADPSASRWTLKQGLERTSKINCRNSFMPFWGEKLTWKNNQLK